MRLTIAALLSLLLVSSETMLAQNGFKQTVFGMVLDAETNRPLEAANVFIANSTLGAATNAKGHFAIYNVPLGTYDIIASVIGYKVSRIPLRITGPIEKFLVFKLKPTVLEAPAIEISAADRRRWRANLERFTKQFLGNTQNASYCKILNPFVLDFHEEDRDIFNAVAHEPLTIENKSLGYRVEIVLQHFECVDELIRYAGIPKFEELSPKIPAEPKIWKRNRIKAYNGSLRHFLATLCKYYDKLQNEHDEMTIARIQESGYDGFFAYATTTPWEGRKIRNAEIVDVTQLIIPGDLPTERKLSFSGYIDVTYTNELEEPQYRKDKNEFRGIREQRSLVKLNVDTLVVDTWGNFYNAFGIRTYGYWAWERVAEMLPLDYTRPEDLLIEKENN